MLVRKIRKISLKCAFQVCKSHLFIKFYIFSANNGEQLSWPLCLRKENSVNSFHHIYCCCPTRTQVRLSPHSGAPQPPIVNYRGCAFAILSSQSDITYTLYLDIKHVILIIPFLPPAVENCFNSSNINFSRLLFT